MSNVVEFVITAKNKLAKPVGAARGAINGLGKAIFSLKGLIATAGVGLLGKQFLDAAVTTEQLNVRLRVLLGSVGEGNALFRDMSEYASQVPFEFEGIMASATQLAGVLKGGRNEINQWMPLIGDLAATTGLSIEQTTEQVSRMLSAGAASADMFRERGVLSMLGFQAGVSYTAEETRKQLMNAWKDPTSQFAGATEQLAQTFTGIMSMITDKWFQLRTILMDAGVMDFIKAVAKTFDEYLGKAVDAVKNDAEGYGNAIVDAGFKVIEVVGKIADIFRGLQFAIKAVETLFKAVAFAILKWFDVIAQSYIELRTLLDEDYKPPQALVVLNDAAKLAKQSMMEAKQEMDEIAMKPMPSESIEEFKQRVVQNYNEMREAAKAANQEMGGGGTGETTESANEKTAIQLNAEANALALENEKDALRDKVIALQEAYLEEGELARMKYEQDLVDLENAHMLELIEDDIYYTLKEQREQQYLDSYKSNFQGAHLAVFQFQEALRKKDVSGALEAGQQILATAATQSKKAFKLQKAAGIAQAIVNTYKGVSYSLSEYPMPMAAVMAAIHLAVGLANVNKIKSQKFGGQAHAGLTNVPNEGTFLLQRGERVLAPEQNRDLTAFLNEKEAMTGGVNDSPVTIENLTIHVLENATNGDALLRMSSSDIEEVVAMKFIPALDSLARRGIVQEVVAQNDEA